MEKLKPDKFTVKSNFLKLILKEYSIRLTDIKNINNIYSTMKSSEGGLYITRDIMKVILPGKLP